MIKDIIISVLILIAIVLLWAAIFDTNRFTVSKYTISNKKIRKPFRAVVLADLHNKSYGKDNIRLFEAIEDLSPDMILIAGDMINGRTREKVDQTVRFLENIAKKYPVYYGNGNHEMRLDLYRDRFGDKYDVYAEKLKKAGIVQLVNERVVLDDFGVAVIGSEINKKHYKRMGIVPMDKGEFEKTVGKPDPENLNIVLAHNPDFFEDYVEYGGEVFFAGHVHGGIVRIPFINKGVLSPNVSFFPKYYQGEYKKNGTDMIVSRGLGAHTIPFRLFNPGDLVTVDFIPGEDK